MKPKDQFLKNPIEKPRKELVDFRNEITGYIRDYKSGKIKGEMYTISLITNVDDLIGEDLDMWEKADNYEKKPIPQKDLNIYQEHIEASKSSSRYYLHAYILQKITPFSSLNIKIEKNKKND